MVAAIEAAQRSAALAGLLRAADRSEVLLDREILAPTARLADAAARWAARSAELAELQCVA